SPPTVSNALHTPLATYPRSYTPPTSPPLPYTTLFRSILTLNGGTTTLAASNQTLFPGQGVASGQALDIGPAATLDLSGHTQLVRSEEHTSELQSQSNLVCRLLLEKKKD